MFIFGPVAYPFIVLFNWIAKFFLLLSNWCYWAYDKALGASMWLNDITESNYWTRD